MGFFRRAPADISGAIFTCEKPKNMQAWRTKMGTELEG